MRINLVLLVLLFILKTNEIGAENVVEGSQKIERFASKQGFLQNTIHAITTDQNGYLWIATPNGLVRYDGYDFEYFYHNYQNDESIPGNKIKHLQNDSFGKLWIGTDQGLCLYLTGKEQFVRLKNEIGNESFLKEGFQKKIWVGIGSELHVFNPDLQIPAMVNEAIILDFDQELEGESMVDMEFLADSVILLATPKMIYKVTFNEKQNYTYKIQKLLLDYCENDIVKIIKTDNTLWIGTNNGVYHSVLENNHLITIQQYFNSTIQTGDSTIDVLTMFIDSEKNLWIGTRRNGILKYESNVADFVSYKFDPKNVFGLTSNRINCFYEDAFGVMWIGTAQGGLNKLDKFQKSFQNYTHNPYDSLSLPSNLINDIVEDKDGRIWISFFDHVICRTKSKIDISEGRRIKFDRLEKQFKALKNQIVVRLFQDVKGYWWIGTQQGLFFYDESNKKLRKVLLNSGKGNFSTVGNRVIEQISSNKILIAGSQVYLLDNPWKWVLHDKPVPVNTPLFDLDENNTINAFKEDGFGNLWFGTQNGIYRVVEEDNTFVLRSYLHTNHEEDSLRLSHNQIFCIHEDQDRNIWLGSFGGGLMKIKLNHLGEPESIKIYHKRDGLPDEVVYGILADKDGKLWMSTDMGICRFDPASKNFEVYNVNDGILNSNFRQGSYYKTKNGLMLMGGLNGLTIFNPAEITTNEIMPKVLISKLRINNHRIVAGKMFNKEVILTNSIADTKKLVLDHNNRNISLDIIVQHTSAPKKNRIMYMLKGVNSDWIEFDGGKTTATYTNLTAGMYRFLFKGSNGDGIWTDETSELEIKVLAPWYSRWYSLSMFGLIILLFANEVYRYRIRLETLKQKLKFEQLDKERIHDMDQAKLRFFTNITHEFKTPLSLIIGPLEKIAQKYKLQEDQNYFSIIQNNISRLQRLIDQLISYRRAETGHLKLNYTKTTLGNFIYPLLEAFEENAKRTNINFYYKVNAPNRQVIIDVDNTERILLNLYSNAIKFTEQDGEVRIEAGFEENESGEIFYIEVSDTGIGIPNEKIDKIFDRFYQASDDQGVWNGTGIGLDLCKSLIELMNGNISVESIPGKKTVFKIELPSNVEVKAVKAEDMNKYRRIVTDWMPAELSRLSDDANDKALPSLLIVDDEQDIRSFLHESFKDKYKVTLAVDGEDGLKKILECQPQLVISDVMMPKLDGYQLCEKIKSNIKTCHIPVILLTALEEGTDEIKGLENGADVYIRKPFSINHLEVTVRKLIENRKKIFDYFADHSIIKTNQSFDISDNERAFLEELTVIILKNMANSDFGVEELAKAAGMSNSSFYRRLKKLTGQTPSSYLRNFRLQKAVELLQENKDLNVTQAMYEIGIESSSYFSSSFKKLYKLTPSEYVKKIRKT